MRSPTITKLSIVAVAGLLAGCGGGIGGVDVTGGPSGSEEEAAVARLATEPLTMLPCGHAFTAITADEQVRIQLYRGEYSDAPEQGVFALGAGEWVAEVVVGKDLAANWCDDVIEEGEPMERIDAKFPLTGDLAWSAPGTDCGDGTATATVSSPVVDVEGAPVTLSTLQLSNESFGCFAG